MLRGVLVGAALLLAATGCLHAPKTDVEGAREPRCRLAYRQCRGGWADWTKAWFVGQPGADCIGVALVVGAPFVGIADLVNFAKCKPGHTRCLRGLYAATLAPELEARLAALDPEVRKKVDAAIELLELHAHEPQTQERRGENEPLHGRYVEGTRLVLVYEVIPEGVRVYDLRELPPAPPNPYDGLSPPPLDIHD